MPRRPDIAALARRTIEEAGQGSNGHPLRKVLTDENAARILLVPVDQLEANPKQPRQHFDQASLDELTASIREVGILQPLIAMKQPGTATCMLIAGERRLRAAKAAGLREVPVLLRTPDDAAEVALIENLQRENLNAIEEAQALFNLKEAKGYTDAALAKIIGKSRVSVTETMALNRLPEAIKAECRLTDKWQKTQLLQVLRAGPPEKMQAAWAGLRTGELTTSRQVKKRANSLRGRRENYRHTYQPTHRRFQVTVTFARSRANSDDVRAALKEALAALA
jgi:ParB family chromosome partitioning protein